MATGLGTNKSLPLYLNLSGLPTNISKLGSSINSFGSNNSSEPNKLTNLLLTAYAAGAL